jgi:hypothetical protein
MRLLRKFLQNEKFMLGKIGINLEYEIFHTYIVRGKVDVWK